MNEKPNRRATKADTPTSVVDPVAIARAEARNGLRQAYVGEQIAMEAIERGSFKCRPSLILALNREALRDLSSYAGTYRSGPVTIGESGHAPPDAHLVPELVEDMCEFINERWDQASPLFLAAYVMWRLNWIHPFVDGNGRTSRTASYVILSIKAGYVPSGSPSIPAQIEANRKPYFDALEFSDRAWKDGHLDVSEMQHLLEALLAKQLLAFFHNAGGVADDLSS